MLLLLTRPTRVGRRGEENVRAQRNPEPAAGDIGSPVLASRHTDPHRQIHRLPAITPAPPAWFAGFKAHHYHLPHGPTSLPHPAKLNESPPPQSGSQYFRPPDRAPGSCTHSAPIRAKAVVMRRGDCAARPDGQESAGLGEWRARRSSLTLQHSVYLHKLTCPGRVRAEPVTSQQRPPPSSAPCGRTPASTRRHESALRGCPFRIPCRISSARR